MNNFFNITLKHKGISFRFAKGKSLRPGNEIHPFNEILYFIDSRATFLSNSYKEDLKKESLLVIPKETYHKFQIKDSDNYTRLVINFPDFPEGEALIRKSISEIKITEPVPKQAKLYLERMCSILENDSSPLAPTALYGLFLSLLYELSADTNITCSTHQHFHPAISKCIRLIDTDFTLPLTAKSISDTLGISPSSLMHLFKKEMGTTLHSYITQKRIIYAHKLIKSGEAPTQIFFKCGYKDYSSFYKAYVKIMGKSPASYRYTE